MMNKVKARWVALVAVLAALFVAPSVWATGNPWDQMFTDAGTAITSLSGSAATLIGLVFAGIILLFVGYKLVRKASSAV